MAELMEYGKTGTEWVVDTKALAQSVSCGPRDYPEDCKVMAKIAEFHEQVSGLIRAEEDNEKIQALAKEWLGSAELAADLIQNTRREMAHDCPSPRERQRLAGRYDAALYDQAKNKMIAGFLWTIGGATVTGVTYAMADPGGIFVIMWGAIVFGIIDIFKGLFGMASHSRNGRYNEG